MTEPRRGFPLAEDKRDEHVPPLFPPPTGTPQKVPSADPVTTTPVPPPAVPPPATPAAGDVGLGSVAPVVPILRPPTPGTIPLPSSVQPGTFGITPYRTRAFAPRRLLGSGRYADLSQVFGPGTSGPRGRPIDEDPRTAAILQALFGGL